MGRTCKKRAALLLAAVLAVLPVLGGCSEKTSEDIFTETIHDFEGHQVVNLDEREDTNFVVYAKGVREIEISDSSNSLVASAETDEAARTYSFSNPNEELSSLQPGDVFWAAASPQAPKGLVVKVKDISCSGGVVTVTSDVVALEDLFTYVDIDMEMPLGDILYDPSQLEEGMEIQIGDAAAAATSASAQTPQVVLLGGEGSWSGAKTTRIVLKSNLDVSIGKSKGNRTAAGRFQAESALTIRQIRVQFKYSLKDKYFFSDISYDIEESVDYSVSFEGSWSNGRGGMGQTWPSFCIIIPHTPIMVGGEFYLLVTLSGSMEGSFKQSADFTMGISNEIVNFVKSEPTGYCDETGNSSSASLELEGKAEVMYGGRIDVGIPFVVDVFLEGGPGVEAVGNLALLGEENGEASVHDCRKCLDGDVNLYCRSSCGVDVRLLSTITGYDLVIRKTLGEISAKIGDFYASYRDGADGGVECGWGECPHLRWKVEVSVLTGEGQPAAGATIRATYPDGRTDEKVADDAGRAVLYLPSGDNRLNCRHMGQSGGVNAPVDGAPAAAAIRLEEKRQIFIVYNFADYADELKVGHDCTEFGELYAMLSGQYPDAVWLKWREEWLIHTDTETLNSGYSLEGLQAVYGLSPGDIVVFLDANKDSRLEANSSHTLYLDTGYDYLVVTVSIALWKTQGEPASGIPKLYTTYRSKLDRYVIYSTWSPNVSSFNYVTSSAFYNCFEEYRQVRYDSGYRYKDTTQFDPKSWEDKIYNGEAILLSDFYVSYPAQPYLAQFAQRALPYIDLLLEDNWEDGLKAWEEAWKR